MSRLLWFSLLLFSSPVLWAETVAIRSSFFDFVDDPWKYPAKSEQSAMRFVPDGLLVIEDGKIKDFGPYSQIISKHSGVKVTEYKERIIMPGMIDCHVHYPTTGVIACFSDNFYDWLEVCIFPEELKFTNADYARSVAKAFFDDILASGTTTVQSFATTAPTSVNVFFEEATTRNMRVICGLTGMDRKGSAPADYLDTADSFYTDSKKLVQQYHRKGRNLYAITIRFAASSTADQMQACQKLKKEYPDLWFNTHLAVTPESTRLALRLFPQAKDTLDIYEMYGLVGPKFTGGHGIYLSNEEFQRLSKLGAAIAFCPRSNLFLGHGLFRLGESKDPQSPVRLGVGSDVAGGDSFSLLQVLNEGYKVGMLNSLTLSGAFNLQQQNNAEAERNKLSAYRGLYLATLGGAQALYLDEWLGNFKPGKEADFIVINPNKGPPGLAFCITSITFAGCRQLSLPVSPHQEECSETKLRGKLCTNRS